MLTQTRTRRRAVLLFLLALPAAAFAVNGQIMYTEGDVAWRNGAAAHDAAIGDSLGPGDVITTCPQSLAVIDLANGTTLKLKEKTTLAIDSIGDATAVTLTAGAVFTTIAHKLTGRFSVNTQTAVAGVRGTELAIRYRSSGSGNEQRNALLKQNVADETGGDNQETSNDYTGQHRQHCRRHAPWLYPLLRPHAAR